MGDLIVSRYLTPEALEVYLGAASEALYPVRLSSVCGAFDVNLSPILLII